MLRFFARPVISSSTTCPAQVTRHFTASTSTNEASDEDLQDARRWLDTLEADTIPQSICEMSFSRSSGPGGQNVNKVNSKATLQVPLEGLLRHIPTALHPEIRSSRYIAPRSNLIIIQADDNRKQTDNAHSCYQRLHQMIIDAGRKAVPGETSAEQSKRVKKLQNTENEYRLKGKKQHSAKKSSRRSTLD